MALLMGIDIGTSSCKVAVFGENGNVIASSTKDYNVYYPAEGWAEQNPDEWWISVCLAIKDVLSHKDINASDIAGIGVDGQSWSAIPVDRSGDILANTPIWMDTRSKDICDEVKSQFSGDEIFNLAGNDFLPSYSTPKMLWFKRNYPDIFSKTKYFLQSNSFIVYKLTGEFSQDLSQVYGIHFFNMNTLELDGDMAKSLGLNADLIPPLFSCDKTVGKVTKKASELTGLSEGTPVVAGGLDAACGTLGAGVINVGQTQEQGGQAGGMSICTGSALSHKKLILSPHVVPGKWLLQGGTVGGGGALKWFRQQFMSDFSFDDITEEARKIKPGSDGVIFLPFMAGERSPLWDPEAKGVFYGLAFSKSRSHMIRAVLEGTSYALYHNLKVAGQTGAKIDTLRAMGGAANSELWTQIKSDVTGRTIEVPASDTATTLGAAILAGIGTGVYQTYEEAVAKTIKVSKVYKPNTENHELYEHYMEIYLELIKSLSPVFHM